ncbi:hypothetical protein LROSRS0_0277 [Furfurilactobacillus rossiae]|nr:hypothetical protein LROSRS0_0277 [Furfurilactobacillus rossiae]
MTGISILFEKSLYLDAFNISTFDELSCYRKKRHSMVESQFFKILPYRDVLFVYL